MGGGSYSLHSRSLRSETKGYTNVTKENLDTVFEQQKKRKIHEQHDPNGVVIRESRDSEEHPLSYAILIGLDVTGSMGAVPAKLIRNGLPHMIQRMFEAGIPDPQVGFVSIGDHECDRYPLQLGQFESSDEKLDDSLTKMYLEGGGGGNSGESYILAWYHAAFHTAIDCLEKRDQKGLLVTVGDEPPLMGVSGKVLANLYGLQSEKDFTAQELFEKALEKYEVYHINVGDTYSGSRSINGKVWKEIIGDRFIKAQSHEKVPEIIGDLASKHYEGERKEIEFTNPSSIDVDEPTTDDDDKVML